MKSTFLFFGLCAAVWAQTGSVDHKVARMKTDERVVYLQGLVGQKPADSHLKILLAAAFLQKMRETTDFSYIDRASKLVDAVLTSDADNYEARRLQTEVLLEYHQFAKAAESSRKLIARNPSDPWGYGTLGDALIEMGNYDEGADTFQKMVDLRPDLGSYNRAAHYRFLTGDADGAVDIMKHAISAGSSSPENVAWCLVELGGIYFKTGRLVDAEEAYRRALVYFPGSHAAHAGLGKVQAAQGKLPEAIASYAAAEAGVPLPEYASALADLYAASGKKAESAKEWQRVDVVYKLMKANGEKVNRNLAVIFADHDRNLDAALSLAQAELDFRKDIYTYDALAWALCKNKRYEEAEKASAIALKMGAPEPAFYYHAGVIASALGKRSEAGEFWKKAAALNPRFDFVQGKVLEERLKGDKPAQSSKG